MTENTTETEYPKVVGSITHYSPEVEYNSDTDSFTANGIVYSAVKAKVEKELDLKDYKHGDDVEVIRLGDFIPGTVSGVEKNLNLLYVNTERGPITVGSKHNIRPRQS